MLDSLFIINNSGDIIIERHWRGRLSRQLGDEFWKQASKCPPHEVPPVIVTPKHYLIHTHRDKIFYVAVVTHETQPLMVIELLNAFVEILKAYLGQVDDLSIKQHFTVIYQLLDEMIDNGYPITTELSLLTDLVRPPADAKAKVHRPKGNARSPVPWRKLGIKYSNNEIFFDVVEEVNCIVDSSGSQLRAEIFGRIQCNCRLSGMPDILLRFQDPSLIKDCSFHPCVRYNRYDQDQSLSFVPPDGEFELMHYRNDECVANLPIYCRAQINVYNDGGNLNIMVSAKMRAMEEVKVYIPLSHPIQLSHLHSSQGTLFYENGTRELRWNIGKVPLNQSISLSGQFSTVQTGQEMEGVGAVRVVYRIPSFALSSLKVDKVDIVEPSIRVKPYRGVRYVTTAGLYEIRV